MENLGQLLSYLFMVSVASERFVEIIKATALSQYLNKTVYIQILAGVFGAAVCFIEPPQLAFITLNKYMLIVLIGLAVSGGSGVWHDALEVVKNFGKTLKQ